MRRVRRTKGLTLLSTYMAFMAFGQIGYLELLLRFESSSESLFAVFSVMSGILAGISSYGFWKVRTWTFRVFASWGISLIPFAITMKYYVAEFAAHHSYHPLAWSQIMLLLVGNLVFVAIVLRYVYKVTHQNAYD